MRNATIILKRQCTEARFRGSSARCELLPRVTELLLAVLVEGFYDRNLLFTGSTNLTSTFMNHLSMANPGKITCVLISPGLLCSAWSPYGACLHQFAQRRRGYDNRKCQLRHRELKYFLQRWIFKLAIL